jgi:hypothetical protein
MISVVPARRDNEIFFWPEMTHISPKFNIYLATFSSSTILFLFDSGGKLD